VALDEQIFAVQAYGGISRLFYEKASAFVRDRSLGIDLEPLDAPIVNHYVMVDDQLAQHLRVREVRNPYLALGRYLTRRRRRSSVDIVHNTFYLPRGLGEHKDARRIVTVYDMIPELMPKTRRRMDFLTEKHRYVREADHIICISESTRSDLLAVYPDVRAPISIAYPGVGNAFAPGIAPLDGFPERFVLHVGNRSGYKDGATLLRAFAAVAPRHPGLVLFLVGGGPLSLDESRMAADLGISDRIVQRLLSDDEVPAAYANAVVTVFPSRYEGFGLPAVEAMASASPLVLADTSSLPEVGGEAARYFSPGDAAALAGVLGELLEDDGQRSDLAERGLTRARRFTWAGYAESNVTAYREALGRPKHRVR
jgi:glycosyltransferase involved in cell wall biosynthesis